MNRTTGTSILVFGIVLGVIGAVMYWAVTANTDGFDINTAGLILRVGAGITIIGLFLTLTGNRSTPCVARIPWAMAATNTRKSTARSDVPLYRSPPGHANFGHDPGAVATRVPAAVGDGRRCRGHRTVLVRP